jgi:hypothetical protein
MKKYLIALLAIVILLLSGIAVTSAQPPNLGTDYYPGDNPGYYPSYYPSYYPDYNPGYNPGYYPDYPTPQPTYPTPQPTTAPGHPTTLPSYLDPGTPRSIPSEAPTSKSKPYDCGLKMIAEPSTSHAISGGYSTFYQNVAVVLPSRGLHIWIRSPWGGWVDNAPVSMRYGTWVQCLTRNDQTQTIWAFERYPGGWPVWQNWGFKWPGYSNWWFGADARGWHTLAMWGSRTGWSNVIYVYVN